MEYDSRDGRQHFLQLLTTMNSFQMIFAWSFVPGEKILNVPKFSNKSLYLCKNFTIVSIATKATSKQRILMLRKKMELNTFENNKRKCNSCRNSIDIQDHLSWDLTDFCSENCLLNCKDGNELCFCGKEIRKRGKYQLRINRQLKVFCSQKCLAECYIKVCNCCEEIISDNLIQDSSFHYLGIPCKFCSNDCRRKTRCILKMDPIPTHNDESNLKMCTLCGSSNLNVLTLMYNEVFKFFCSESCKSVFIFHMRTTGGKQCNMCKNYFNFDRLTSYFDGLVEMSFCSKYCRNIFKLIGARTESCDWCKNFTSISTAIKKYCRNRNKKVYCMPKCLFSVVKQRNYLIWATALPMFEPVFTQNNVVESDEGSQVIIEEITVNEEQKTEELPVKKRKVQDAQLGLGGVMKLDCNLGINAWNTFANTNEKIPSIQLDLLKLSPEKLSLALCLFLEKLRKPNGENYAPDTFYYFCLGIQQYLNSNGRCDNIFLDVIYEKFAKCLDELAKAFYLEYIRTGYIVTRVEEIHLWESGQLGTYPPSVLLFTLVYFNTKYYNLTTVGEHTALTFHHKLTYIQYGKRKWTAMKFNFCCNETDDKGRCPFQIYRLYLRKCPDSMRNGGGTLYLAPEMHYSKDSPVWFSTRPLQKDSLEMMLNRVKMVQEIIAMI